MSRITKQLARQVAEKMVGPLEKKMDELEKELEEKASVIYNRSLPKEIKELPQEIINNWVRRSSSAFFKGPGLNNEYVSLSKSLPARYSNGSLVIMVEDVEEAKEISKIFSKRGKLSAKVEILQKQIEETIFRLGTFKKVEAQFPEAFEILKEITPETTKSENMLAVQISDITKQLETFIPK